MCLAISKLVSDLSVVSISQSYTCNNEYSTAPQLHKECSCASYNYFVVSLSKLKVLKWAKNSLSKQQPNVQGMGAKI